jgi:carboxymethylenebutenolidase
MKTETVALTVDSSAMSAFVAHPETPAKVGIIIFQEAFGVNDYIKDVTQRFAKEGYLAIAPELFHRTGEHVEISYTTKEGYETHMGPLTTESIEADAKAAYEWLKSQGIEKVVSIGFCMGGRASFIANTSLPLTASVSYYGGGIMKSPVIERVQNVSGPMLFFWGGKDTHIPREGWSLIPAAFDKAGKSHITVEMGDAEHGFFCDQRASYSKEASAIAWPMTLNFLKEKTV